MPDARWATVLIDPETMEPREAAPGELEELDDLGIPVDRCWIAPGPPRDHEAGCECDACEALFRNDTFGRESPAATIQRLNADLEAAAGRIAATLQKWDAAANDASGWQRRYYHLFHNLRAVDPDVRVRDLCLDFTCPGCSNPGCCGLADSGTPGCVCAQVGTTEDFCPARDGSA